MNKFYLFIVLSFSILNLKSQKLDSIAPGGVQGAVVWMKTVPLGNDLHGQYLWRDFSGDSSHVKYYNEDNEYVVSRDYFARFYNFNPSIHFTYSTLSKEFEVLSSNLSTATIIGAFSEYDFLDRANYMLAINGVAGKGVMLNTDKIINSKESDRRDLDYGLEEGYDLTYHTGKSPEVDLNAYKARTMRSLTYFRTNQPNTSVWGERRSSDVSLGQKFYWFNKYNNSTYDTSLFNPDNIFYAHIPELFIYNRLLTPLERVKAESYLAIKYGFMLENSFLGSDGHLLWDINSQKKYNYRVAGLYRDDASGLNQRISSTSYEEAPYFSYLTEGDSYDNANTYSLSNKNKLLVIEKFPGGKLEDKEYIVWGDNNESLKATKQMEELLGVKMLDRTWKVNTNTGGKDQAPRGMQWDISSNAEVIEEDYKLASIKKINANKDAVISSTEPLSGYEGHISLLLTDPLGPTIVKFGTKNVPEVVKSNDYGVFIDEQGYIYPIIKGQVYWNKWGYKAFPNLILRINKTKEYIFVSINGSFAPQVGYTLPQIFIDKEDIDKDFYASLGIYGYSTISPEIKNFRVGGISEMGNRVELSYKDTRASDLANYATNGQAYMFIDRSGTGEFKKEDTEIYPSDEYDKDRSKIVFNNIFFDTDVNQEDVFTFGYRESNIIANVEKTNPSCDKTTGLTQADGKINIEIKQGDEGFEYQLTNKETSKVVKQGVFFGNNLELDSLSQGNYSLKLKELGGFHILSDSTGVDAKANSHQSIDWDRGGYFETTLRDLNQNFQVGLMPSVTMSNAYIQYGFEVQEGKIYIITNGVKSTSPLAGVGVKAGDKIQIYEPYNLREVPYKVYYRINGNTFYTQAVSQYRFFVVKLNNNVGGLYNVKNTDGKTYFNPRNWNSQGVNFIPKTGLLSETSVEHSISLSADCTKKEEDLQIPVVVKAEENLSTYYKDYRNQSEITAYVKLDSPSPITISIFDFSANMVYTQEIKESKKEHTVDIKGLTKGVYILKVFSQGGEFTKKITIN